MCVHVESSRSGETVSFKNGAKIWTRMKTLVTVEFSSYATANGGESCDSVFFHAPLHLFFQLPILAGAISGSDDVIAWHADGVHDWLTLSQTCEG